MGRPQLQDYVTDQGSLGIPADSRGVFSVTSASLDNRTLPYAVAGTPAYLDLAKQQLLFVHDQVGIGSGAAFGTPLANAYAAGMTASLLSSGMSRAEVQAWLRSHQGHVLRLPQPRIGESLQVRP